MRISTWVSLAMTGVLVWVAIEGAQTLKERRLREPDPAPVQATPPPDAPPVAAPRSAPAPRGTTIVLPAAIAPDLVSQCSRWPPAIEGAWDVPSPVVDQLAEDFPRIAELVASRCCEEGARIADPGAFHHQVAGVVIDGRQMVYVSAVGTAEPDPQWQLEPVRVCDGGASFWGVLYDPETREFSELAVNGRG